MSKLLAAVLALLATTAGVAVAAPPGGSGPAGPAAGPADDPARNGSASAGPGAVPADGGAASAGPPVDLPSPVPDFVSSIHDLVREHVNGDLSGPGLGEALADLLGGTDAGQSGDDRGSGPADAGEHPNA